MIFEMKERNGLPRQLQRVHPLFGTLVLVAIILEIMDAAMSVIMIGMVVFLLVYVLFQIVS
jgi:hypothetical protein